VSAWLVDELAYLGRDKLGDLLEEFWREKTYNTLEQIFAQENVAGFEEYSRLWGDD